jgi:hypothetical protein
VTGDYTYSIGGVTFGHGTRYRVSDITGLGSPGWRDGDVNVAGAHGSLPVVDYLEKRTISFQIAVVGRTPEEAMRLMRDLATAWTMRAASTPGNVRPLSIQLPSYGSPLSFIGRPRRFEPVLARVATGHIPIAADYVAHDPLVYGPEASVLMGLGGAIQPDGNGVMSYASGLQFPLAFPMVFGATPGAPTGTNPRTLPLGGDYDSWPLIEITGPCLGPRAAVGDSSYSFPELTLAVNDVLVIDTHPARRGVILNGVTSKYTSMAAGTRLNPLAPGNHNVTFSARTYDARARASFSVRPATIA